MPRLRWPHLQNARDLGGLPAGHGAIRPHRLIRTDNHDRLSAAGIAALDAYGVSRIVDLRWEWEATKYPSPLSADPRYRLHPACSDQDSDEEIVDSYRSIIDNSRERLSSAIVAIAEAPVGPVVVHCHSGRDRTGIVVALALRIAGVPDDAIAADYARTPDSPPTMITHTLAHLAAAYGGVNAYLCGGGVTPRHLTALRGRLVD